MTKTIYQVKARAVGDIHEGREYTLAIYSATHDSLIAAESRAKKLSARYEYQITETVTTEVVVNTGRGEF